MADRSIISFDLVDEYDIIVDDLSVWELINPSSSEDDFDEELGGLDDDFSLTDDELTADDVVDAPTKGEEAPLEFGPPPSDISMESLSAQLHQLKDGDVGGGVVVTEVAVVDVVEDNDHVDDDYVSNDGGDDDYDDYDDGYGLDDELVPWDLSDKFGKQRIRKMGKRACPKMNKAKRLPYSYYKPRCVHGKHSFGVQFSY